METASSTDIDYINNVMQVFNAIKLNKRYNHLNDVVNDISKSHRYIRSNSLNATEISCFYNDCLADPMAKCLRCSKYSCYEHIQLCFQIHPNEIEIIRSMKHRINM
jgi:hypothetical protein